MCLTMSDHKLTISTDLWTLTPELQCQEVSYSPRSECQADNVTDLEMPREELSGSTSSFKAPIKQTSR